MSISRRSEKGGHRQDREQQQECDAAYSPDSCIYLKTTYADMQGKLYTAYLDIQNNSHDVCA